MKITRAALLALVIAIALLPTVNAAGSSCESLLKFMAANTTVTLAEQVPAGGFRAPGAAAGAQNASRFSELPAFCRVAATLKPTADSDIKIEVWMPASGWNGKFEAVGNGGWAGTISYPAMAQALARGYATTSTDTGHSTPGAQLRARTSREADRLRLPLRARDDGQGEGDRQCVLRERPDAVVLQWMLDWRTAGADRGVAISRTISTASLPARPRTRRRISIRGASGWDSQTMKDPATRIPTEKYPAIHQAVLAACDALDGLKDGLIDDPTRCHFDPQRAGVQGSRRTGLPDAEAGAIRQHDPGAGEEPAHRRRDLPGLPAGHRAAVGSPDRWTRSVRHRARSVQDMVFNDPKWDWRTFDVDRDLAKAEQITARAC